MLTPLHIYNLGREAFLRGIRRDACTLPHSQMRAEWDRGYVQERNDQLDVVQAIKGVS